MFVYSFYGLGHHPFISLSPTPLLYLLSPIPHSLSFQRYDVLAFLLVRRSPFSLISYHLVNFTGFENYYSDDGIMLPPVQESHSVGGL